MINPGQHIATAVINHQVVMTPQLVQRTPPFQPVTDEDKVKIYRMALQQIQAISTEALKHVWAVLP